MFIRMFSRVSFLIVVVIAMFASRISGEATRLHKSQKQLVTDVFANYSKYVRPVEDGNATEVEVFFWPESLIALDETTQSLHLKSTVVLCWSDLSLTWNSSEYDDINVLFYPQSQLWLPPVKIGPSTTKQDQLGFDENLVGLIGDSGGLYWQFEAATETECEIDVTLYPFDTQTCTINLDFAPMNKEFLELQPREANEVKRKFAVGGTWQLLGMRCYRYSDELTAGIAYVLSLKRRTTFYLLNIVLPVISLSFTASVVFIVPAEAGEKMGFSITILLAYSVYLSIIADNLPQTSAQICYLQVYLTFLLGVTAFGVVVSGLVLKLHHMPDDVPVGRRTHGCARLLRRLIGLEKEPAGSCKYGNENKPSSEFYTKNAVVSDKIIKTSQLKCFDGGNGYVGDVIHDVNGSIDPAEMTWPQVAEAVDRVSFIVVSLEIVLSTASLFPYLAIAGNAEVEDASSQISCVEFI